MANIMTKRGSQDNVITYEHICDTAADMANIESRYITLGSTCIVLKGESDGLEVYMANTAHEWESLLDNSAAASGEVQPIDFHICSQSEYNSTTLQPTISSPDSNTFYLVPASEETGNLYDEWVYLDSKWERFGGAKIPSYTEATIAAAGLMSATDKAKLDQFLAASNYVTEATVNLLLERIAQLEARIAALESYHAIPVNAVLGEDGTPMTDEQGNYIEYDT